MQELGLRYKGKRCPFLLKNPRLSEALHFQTNTTVVWVVKGNADWLISNNPRMFDIVGERDLANQTTKTVPEIEKVDKVEATPEPEFKDVYGDDGVEGPVVIVEDEGEEVVPETKKKRGMPKGGWHKKYKG